MKKKKKRTAWYANPASTDEENIMKVLNKDFQELSAWERQTLRNLYARKKGVQGSVSDGEIFALYLMEKRKRVNMFETVLITPRDRVTRGVFGYVRISESRQIMALRTPNGPLAGIIPVKCPVVLPLLTMFYFDDRDEAWCLSPEGDFCRVSSTEFVITPM